MVSIINYPSNGRQDEDGGEPSFEEEKQVHSLAAEHIPDDPSARPAQRPRFAPERPAMPRLPSIDEFDFEAASAQRMAKKFAPRMRYGGPYRHPRPPSDDSNDSIEETDRRKPQPRRGVARRTAPSSGDRRAFFWGFGASLVIVLGTSAAFGLVGPLNGLLPPGVESLLGGKPGQEASVPADDADPAAGAPVAGGDPKFDERAPVAAPPMATAAIGAAPKPPPPHPKPAAVPQKPVKDQSRLASLPPAAAAAVPPPATAAAPSPEPKPAPATAARPAVSEPNSAAPVSTVERQAAPPLTAARIDRLLDRGHALLKSGDIASARLLFRRVAATGDRRGAKGVGMTYDPRVYARLAVAGLTPDREQAESWYRKAGEGPGFTPDLSALGAAPGPAAALPEPQGDASGEPEPGSPEWNEACASKYRSFEPETGLYTSYGGAKRACQLP